jgi:hypothetical protein
LKNLAKVVFQYGGLQRGALIFAYGGELRLIARQEELAMPSSPDVLYEVAQEPPVAMAR